MSVTIDSTGLADVVRRRGAEVADGAVLAMFLDMANNAPRDTGEMTNTLAVEEQDDETHLTRVIRAPVDYASYQDEGTGIYGPSGQRIEGNPFLAFTAKDGTRVIVRSVAGTPATHWWSDRVELWLDYLTEAMT